MNIEIAHYILLLIMGLLIIPGFPLTWIANGYIGICLGVTLSFLMDDFSVNLVSLHSNICQPLMYKIAALWGNHEGSILVWIMLSSCFSSYFLTKDSQQIARILLLAFSLILWLTSLPLLKQNSVILDGNQLNPILQDPFLIIHPPLLYLGYISLILPFILSISYLKTGKLEISLVKKGTYVSWIFMTIGIGLGSWWAYHELGWGGYWFWDPVENSALIPWLLTLGLIHALNVYKYNPTKLTPVLWFSILGYLSTLIGTFFVRSGLLNSVHGFANNRGISLGLLTLFLCLYVVYVSYKSRPFHMSFKITKYMTQELLISWSNTGYVVLVCILALGSFGPCFISQPLSVGADFYIEKWIPLIATLVSLLFLVPFISRVPSHIAFENVGYSIGCSLFLGIFLPVTSLTSFFLVLSSSCMVLLMGRHMLNISNKAMLIGHIGIGILLLVVVLNSSFEQLLVSVIEGGDSFQLGDWTFHLLQFQDLVSESMQILGCDITIEDEIGRHIGELNPSRSYFLESGHILTKTHILSNLFFDIYGILGEGDVETGYSIRVGFQPFLGVLWIGCLFLAFGCFLI